MKNLTPGQLTLVLIDLNMGQVLAASLNCSCQRLQMQKSSQYWSQKKQNSLFFATFFSFPQKTSSFWSKLEISMIRNVFFVLAVACPVSVIHLNNSLSPSLEYEKLD